MRRPRRVDIALAGLLGAVAQVEFWTHLSRPASAAVGYAGLVLIATTSLAWREARPMGSTVLGLTALGGLAVNDLSGEVWVFPALLLMPYSAARFLAPSRAAVVLAVALAVTPTLIMYESWGGWWQFMGNYAFLAALMVCVPWAAGYGLRRRQVLGAAATGEALATQRRQIARELHDVVGHSLGVMVVQAGAERATLPSDAAESTRLTLLTIERTGREALTEMRRLVEVMKAQHGATSGLEPQPGLEQVAALVRSVEAAGLPVNLSVEGGPVPLPPGMNLSAYRIIQEALTNVLRHAGPARCHVTVRYAPGAVELEILDDGRGMTRNPGDGFGLTGIRERVALFDGSAAIGPRPSGGYAVRVLLPRDGGAR